MKLMAEKIAGGYYDRQLIDLYGQEKLTDQRQRWSALVRCFEARFGGGREGTFFSAPGRTEIGGNHTDHQHGHVLAAAVNVDALAYAAPNHEGIVRLCSEGYSPVEVDLNALEARETERGSSAALVRGVAARLTGLGHRLEGFDAMVTSQVPAGSGLSSSAAYEVLVGSIFNAFSCGGCVDAVTLAQVSQYAENVYFGKPCGLMDQTASAVGACVAIDFADPARPLVERVDYDFTRSGHVLCIVDTGSCHADLTGDYAAILQEMGGVAAHFGEQFLRQVPEENFRAAIPALREKCGDRAVLRALHFYTEDRRAAEEAEALKRGDFQGFLALVNASGLSSELYLQNAWSPAAPERQAIPLALCRGRELLDGTGAIRVHGGGFAGTVQAFVPTERLAGFCTGMEALLGQGKCHVLHVRAQGGGVVL